MMRRFRWTKSAGVALIAVVGAVGYGCGGNSSGGPDSGSDFGSDADSSPATGSKSGSGSTTGSGGASSGTGSTTGSGSTSGTTTGGSSSGNNKNCGLANQGNMGGANPLSPDFETCAEDSHPAATAPVDLFIMIDQSISMEQNRVIPTDPDSPTRWEVMTEALKGFINSPDSEGLRVGLQYFGLNQNGAVICDPEAYASADIEIAELPGNAGDLTDSIDAHFPASGTPSVPALEGALTYAKAWAEDHPDRTTMVVFATDGYPTECDNAAISDLEALAKEYAEGTPRVPTFVVGIGQVANLERVATAGGTGHAFFVGECDTAVEDLQIALGRIATSQSSCEFAIPESNGKPTDLGQINFSLSPLDGSAPYTFPRLNGESSCGNGWYFDDNSAPTKIIACPNTCASFASGTVDVVIGCETVSLE